MKTFKYHLQEGKDIIIQVPDELDVKRNEVFALAALEAQDQIANGNIEVTKRIWPCFFCDTQYDEQGELLRHLSSHETLEKKLKEKLAHLYKKPEDVAPPKTAATFAPAPTILEQPGEPYEHTDGYKVRQIRSSLGESQAQFAKHFNVSAALVSHWENNMVKARKEVLEYKAPPKESQTAHPQE